MHPPNRKSWIPVALLAGVLYFVAGFGFGTVAGWVASDPLRFGWRLAAWIFSAGVYAAHIWYEHFRLRNAPHFTAMHVAAAVGLGGFLLAIAAIVNSFMTSSGNRPLLFLALVIWPILTGVPAFVVALTGTLLLARFSRKI